MSTDRPQGTTIEYPRLLVISTLVFLITLGVIFGFSGIGEALENQTNVDWIAVTWIGSLIALGAGMITFLIVWIAADNDRSQAIAASARIAKIEADELQERRNNAS